MGKIDTSGWKKKKIDTMEWGEFHLYDIFSISMGNKFDRSKMCEVDKGINFVGRSALTNGVACTVTSVEDKKGNTVQPYPAGDITIALGGSIGAAFVQDRKFYTSQNVCVLHTDDPSITERVKWFVAASITASCGNYEAFTDELNRHIRTDFTIRLPVDKTGQPDWAYMESYMADLEAKVAESLTLLQVAKDAEKKKVDTREWGEFRVGELFDAFLSKDDIQPKAIVEGNTPLVSSGKENNGIIACIDNKNARLWEANTLTVDMFGKVFYQGQPYYAVSHGRVNILMPRMPMTKHCMQFIGCAIERVTTDKYAFSEMCTGTKLLKDVILLPKDKTGQPDWAYMEEYMRKVERKTDGMLNQFIST